MTGKNKTPLVGWHPSDPALVEWLDAEVQRRGGGRGVRSTILDEALAAYAACSVTTTPNGPVWVSQVTVEPDGSSAST